MKFWPKAKLHRALNNNIPDNIAQWSDKGEMSKKWDFLIVYVLTIH